MGVATTSSRPLIPAALAYLCGTAAGLSSGGIFGLHCGFPPSATLLAALAALFLALLCRRSRLPLALAALAAAAFVRAAHARGDISSAEADFVRSSATAQDVTVSGEVFALQGTTAATGGEIRYRFKVKNASFRFRGDPRPIGEPLSVDWYAKPPSEGGFVPKRDMVLEIHGKVRPRRRGSDAPRSIGDVRLVSHARATRLLRDPSAGGFLGRVRAQAAATLQKGISGKPEETSLLLAMTLGYRSDLSPALADSFRRAGTIHVFAISGLHVGAIAAILVGVLSFMGISRKYVAMPLAPILAAYVYMTGMQPSAVRAAVMVVVYFAAPLFGRRPDPLGAVAFTLIAILVADPMQLRELSLILSFSMVVGIILLTGPTMKLFQRLFDSKSAIEERKLAILSERAGDQDARVNRWPLDFLALARHWAVSFFAGAFAAALVSFPLTAYFFDMLTPYSVLANTIVVPLAFPVMAIAGIGLLVSIAFPPIVYLTNPVAAALAGVMKSVSQHVSALPGASVEATFPLWALALWYAVLLLFVHAMAKWKK